MVLLGDILYNFEPGQISQSYYIVKREYLERFKAEWVRKY